MTCTGDRETGVVSGRLQKGNRKERKKKRKTEPKELPSCTIPLLLISYTRELEILAIALELTSKIWYFYSYTDTLAA